MAARPQHADADDRCSEWYGLEALEGLHEQLALGDRLEFKRRLGYCHWAIYSGYELVDGQTVHKIIHRSIPPDVEMDDPFSELLVSKRIGQILESPLVSALPPGDRIRVNNAMDAATRPLDGDEIVARAIEMMSDGQQSRYSLAFNNCEHFVNECRYGVRYSHQVTEGCEVAVNKICEFLTDDTGTRRQVRDLASTAKQVYQMIKSIPQ